MPRGVRRQVEADTDDDIIDTAPPHETVVATTLFDGVPQGWLPMDTAPDDGKAITVTCDGKATVDAVWRSTRQFDRRNGRWVATGRWALRNTGGQHLPWAPAGWRAVR